MYETAPVAVAVNFNGLSAPTKTPTAVTAVVEVAGKTAASLVSTKADGVTGKAFTVMTRAVLGVLSKPVDNTSVTNQVFDVKAVVVALDVPPVNPS